MHGSMRNPAHDASEIEAAFIHFATDFKKAIHTDRVTARDVERFMRESWLAACEFMAGGASAEEREAAA